MTRLPLRIGMMAVAALATGALQAAPAQDDVVATVVAAMEAGQVGERFDGYLGLVGTVPDAVERAVGATNIKRRSLYLEMAQRKGVSPSEITTAAACTTLARVPVGQYYLLADRVWRKRGVGDAPPVPGYCVDGTISKSGL